jgi:alkyl hydroperoxide reductase subunit F
MLYDLAIIGGGPAGTAAGVYASRKRLHTVLIAEAYGGQSTVSEDIQNWIGTPHISGLNLATSFETHLKTYAENIVDLKVPMRVSHIAKAGDHFKIETSQRETFEAKTVLIAVGSTRRKLTVPGADIYENKGITYCASCDGPVFSDQDVVVIGGGNAGFESAAQLAAYCKSVTILHKNAEFKADEVTVGKVLAKPNVKSILSAELLSVEGDTFVTGLTYKDKVSGETKQLPVTGIFVEIGLIPSTDFVGDVVEKNATGQIVTDPRTQQTKTSGIWAAGDCTDVLYHQNNIAAGDAVRALEDIYLHIHAK